MAKQTIDITELYNAPVEDIFNKLTDHENFGRIVKADVVRVIDAKGEYLNGLGSVRRITPGPLLGFEETVVTFEPNRLMEYVVSKGSPIKNHRGRMAFSEVEGRTRLRYTIEFEPKLPLPFLGPLIKKAIETPLRKGLTSLAKSYR